MVLWQRILRQVKTSNLLRNGYKNLSDPSLYWLFKWTPSGRGIDKVLNYQYYEPEAPQYTKERRFRRRKQKLKKHSEKMSARATDSQQPADAKPQPSPISVNKQGTDEAGDV